jgi:hypothetical protein
MKKITTKAVLIFIIFIQVGVLFSQEEKKSDVQLNVGVDLTNRFIWRGMNLGGNTPSIQPFLSVSAKNFEAGVWSAYSVGGNFNQEFDLFASYTFGKNMFSIVFTDYFSASETVSNKYFNYKSESTGHIFEGMLQFNGTEKFPVTAVAALFFYGADAESLNNDPASSEFNTRTGIQYSNYFEIGYNAQIKKIAVNPFIGFTLTNPESTDSTIGFIGETGFYGNKAGIVNLGITAIKEIKINETFSVPLSTSVIINPQAENVFFVVGLSF